MKCPGSVPVECEKADIIFVSEGISSTFMLLTLPVETQDIANIFEAPLCSGRKKVTSKVNWDGRIAQWSAYHCA